MKEFICQIGKVLRFSFAQHTKGKGYRTGTILGAVIAFLVPILVWYIAADVAKSDAEAVAAEYESQMGWEEEEESVPLSRVIVVDDTEGEADYSLLNMLGSEDFSELVYETAADLDEAEAAAGTDPGTLILLVKEGENAPYETLLLLPPASRVGYENLMAYEDFLYGGFMGIQVQKAELSEEQAQNLVKAAMKLAVEEVQADQDFSEVEIIGEGESGASAEKEAKNSAAAGAEMPGTAETDMAEMPEMAEPGLPPELVQEILAMVLPYLVIMILYFMILFYGQGICNSVILEKTAKLVDTVLICLKPASMVFGKTLAVCLAAVLQFSAWVAGLAAGFAAGLLLCRSIYSPLADEVMGVLRLLRSASGVFTLPGIVLALLIIFAGFLMYGMLAAFGASMASKPEDLSHTNLLFTMALVISFLISLYGGVMESMNGEMWQMYMPFTGMLLAPGAVLAGRITIFQAFIVLLLILLTTVLLALLAGKTYRSLIYYRGKPLSPVKFIRSLLQK